MSSYRHLLDIIIGFYVSSSWAWIDIHIILCVKMCSTSPLLLYRTVKLSTFNHLTFEIHDQNCVSKGRKLIGTYICSYMMIKKLRANVKHLNLWLRSN